MTSERRGIVALYRRVTRPEVAWQFLRYATIGLLNIALYFAIFNLLLWLDVPTLAANAVAFFLTSVNSYVFNKLWTFRDRQPEVFRQYAVFLVFSLIGLTLNSAVLWALLIPFEPYGTAGKNLAAIGAVPVSVIWNFSSYRMWTFARPSGAS